MFVWAMVDWRAAVVEERLAVVDADSASILHDNVFMRE